MPFDLFDTFGHFVSQLLTFWRLSPSNGPGEGRPQGPHSVRSATIGSRRAAFHAG
jgi:hypothetical protein